LLFCFFFQAEDGIRDFHVTVQTCALPIYTNGSIINQATTLLSIEDMATQETSISFLRQSKEIYINSNQNIDKLEVYNLLGKRIFSQEGIHLKTLRLPSHFTNEKYGIVRVYTQQSATNKKLILN